MARVMKDSGIEWIGEIPETWDTIKFKYLFSITGGNGFPENLQGQTEGTYPFCKVSDINGHSDYVDTAANYVSDEVAKEHGFNIIPCGSIIIAKIGAALQKNHRKINSVPCCIDNNTQALVPIRADNLRYLLYLTRCIDMGWFDNNSTVPSLNNNKLLNFFVPNVSVAEQQRIADFLDRKCAEIDAVIEKTKATIEEYKKLKQSVITEAVTKGIRRNRPMKDSGIEWIGEIPKEWEVIKAKYCVQITHGSDPQTEGDVPVYGSGAESFKTCGEYKEGPVVLVGRKGATLHIPHYIEGRYWNVDTAFDVRTNEKYLLRMYYYAALCFDYKYYMSQTTLPGMTQSNYNNMCLPRPTMVEQKEIVAYLDEKCAALDTLIAKKNALFTELETYKKSLIYEYVTGKKEVCM